MTTMQNKVNAQQQMTGLTSAQVQKRIENGDVNVDASVKTRSIAQILRDNICTLFNLVNVILALLVLITGSYKNMLFMTIVLCNVVIGIVQEVRSKKTTDKLSIVASTKATVIRNGKSKKIDLSNIVRDDIIVLGRGAQVPTDSVVISGQCNANESLLTGESKLIPKVEGSKLMSGSFINSGKVYARVKHVGAENYAAKITAEAKQNKEVNSEIMTSLNKIIKLVTCIMFPLGALLFASDFFVKNAELNESILTTVSALNGMIPKGLILLTSTVLAVAVVRLSKHSVLVQQLFCIETLARVDTLCLDKTGTITTGNMKVAWVKPAWGREDRLDEINQAFCSIAASDEDPNETSLAIKKHFERESSTTPLKCTRNIPFSSDKKFSGCVLENGNVYAMGAAQFILGKEFSKVETQMSELTKDARVILLAKVNGFDANGNIEGVPEAIGFVGIADEIRKTAPQTIAYFKDQGVRTIVISGDDAHTVSGIANKVGVSGAENYIDATVLKTQADIENAIGKYNVFGRVKPEQKKAFVLALQKQGHTVAMTGDGVNDTLALKAADCSVAMAAGSDAARNTAQLVLVDNDFASMPKVVAEGRRSINNLQRSASLFLVKMFLNIFCAALFIVLPWQFPFQPIQMTLIGAFTIGIPSFVLALEPNHERIRGKFFENVIVQSTPGTVCAVLSIVLLNCIGYAQGMTYTQVSTMCVLLTCWIGINLIVRLSIPFTKIRVALLCVCVGGIAIGCAFMPNFFALSYTIDMLPVLLGLTAIMTVVFHALYNTLTKRHSKKLAKMV